MALAGVDAQHGHVATVSAQESFEDFDTRGFTSAIWPQEGKDLAALDVKSHIINRVQISIRFAKVLHTYSGIAYFQIAQAPVGGLAITKNNRAGKKEVALWAIL